MYHNWLRSFNAVAKEGSFAAAGRSLNIGQPTVTTQVKALSERFKVELFYRKGHQTWLSDTGRALYDITQGIFAQEKEAIEFLRGSSEFESGVLRLAGTGPYDLMEIVDTFSKRFPLSILSLSVETHNDMLSALRDYSLDVGVFAREITEDDIHCTYYSSHDVVIMVSRVRPWISRRTVRLKELEKHLVILKHSKSATRQAFEQACDDSNLVLDNTMIINSREAVREAVIRGLGIAPVVNCEFIPDKRLHTVRVSDVDMKVLIYICCLKRRLQRQMINGFLELVNESKAKKNAGSKVKARASG